MSLNPSWSAMKNRLFPSGEYCGLMCFPCVNGEKTLTWPGAPAWGYTVTGTGATIDSAFSGSKYAGYTSGGETIASRTGTTGASADTISIANRVAINYASASGVYSDTVTYTVTPNYN